VPAFLGDAAAPHVGSRTAASRATADAQRQRQRR
jgi:hypothetical protein